MARWMEESLGMPLHEVLAAIQDRVTTKTTYWGIQTMKSPLDFWVYQEIIFEARPEVIVELGTLHGGSALALAHLCDLLGSGKVISIDVSHRTVPHQVRAHPRIVLLEADACAAYPRVEQLVARGQSVLVIEDSSHTYANTLGVLRTYSALVRPGGYFIVEDGICHHGLAVGPSPGPYEAVEAFVAEHPEFECDRSRESFLVTWNPKGYLRRRP